MGEGNFQDYGMRMYNPRIGRFFAIDPLTKYYPDLTPYQFASNSPIWAIDLDGLEAKLAISCSGGANTHYSSSDINAFDYRATKLQKSGFDKVSVHNGLMVLNAFKSATKKDGSILSVVSFAHSGAPGIFLDNNDGFYTSNYNNYDPKNNNNAIVSTNYSNIDDLALAVKTGDVKFEKNACWVFASCYTANSNDARLVNGGDEMAKYTAKKLNITTVGATGSVYPEVVGGKETGNLLTDGTFKKYEAYTVTKTVKVKENYGLFGFTFWSKTVTKKVTETKVKETDLGKKVDPKAVTK
jgi:hypothetical protein